MHAESTPGKPVTRWVGSTCARLSDESGFSLVLALIVIAALSISTASLVSLVTSNERAYGRDRQDARVFNVAEAGLNEGISYLSTQNTLLISSVSPTNYTVDGRSGVWSATKTATSPTVDIWTIYARATAGISKRKLSVQVAANKSVVSNPASGVWAKGFFVADPTYCAALNGTTTVSVSVYVSGNLCLNGTQQVVEPTPSPATPSLYLYVGGQVQILGGNAQIGAPSAKIAQANIVGGCLVNGVAKICSSQGQSRVYATPPYLSTSQTLTKPVIDAPGIYAGGDWNHPVCSTGSFTFDTNGARDSSVGTINLLPASAYSCTVYKSSSHVAGNEMGTISWNPATKALAISGTIFLDGDLSFGGGAFASYTGLGTIYVNGRVAVSGNTAFCGPGATAVGTPQPHCNGLWDGALGAIAIVAANTGGTTGMTGTACTSPAAWSMSGTAQMDVAVYVTGCFTQTGNSYVTGPVTTDQGVMAGTPTHTDLPNPPPNTPGAAGSTTLAAWGHVVPSSWRQVPAG